MSLIDKRLLQENVELPQEPRTEELGEAAPPDPGKRPDNYNERVNTGALLAMLKPEKTNNVNLSGTTSNFSGIMIAVACLVLGALGCVAIILIYHEWTKRQLRIADVTSTKPVETEKTDQEPFMENIPVISQQAQHQNSSGVRTGMTTSTITPSIMNVTPEDFKIAQQQQSFTVQQSTIAQQKPLAENSSSWIKSKLSGLLPSPKSWGKPSAELPTSEHIKSTTPKVIRGCGTGTGTGTGSESPIKQEIAPFLNLIGMSQSDSPLGQRQSPRVVPELVHPLRQKLKYSAQELSSYFPREVISEISTDIDTSSLGVLMSRGFEVFQSVEEAEKAISDIEKTFFSRTVLEIHSVLQLGVERKLAITRLIYISLGMEDNENPNIFLVAYNRLMGQLIETALIVDIMQMCSPILANALLEIIVRYCVCHWSYDQAVRVRLHTWFPNSNRVAAIPRTHAFKLLLRLMAYGFKHKIISETLFTLSESDTHDLLDVIISQKSLVNDPATYEAFQDMKTLIRTRHANCCVSKKPVPPSPGLSRRNTLLPGSFGTVSRKPQ